LYKAIYLKIIYLLRFAPENKDKINQYAYMPFGQGPRNCIGKRLALLEVKATIVTLLKRYRIHKTDQLEVSRNNVMEIFSKLRL
jgi:cytochrome P450